MTQEIAIDALINICIHIIFIILAWKALEALNFEKLLKKNRIIESRVLYILLAITIGTVSSHFVIQFIYWSRQLIYLF